MSRQHLTEHRFADLDLSPELQKGIEQAGFEFLTPIQHRVLPHLLAQQDVAGQAQTGTGKTAAFLIAMFTRLSRGERQCEATGPRALILAPTRELAIQIFKDAQVLGSGLPYRMTLAYGGTGYESQRRELEQGVDVLIGTPGRIIDYYKQGVFTLDGIEVMILDEADRMFDLGFIKDIRYVLRRMPPPDKRLNMLFSATLSLRVNELAYEHMNNPQSIKVESEYMTVDAVEEKVYFPANDEKIPLLFGLLKEIDPTRTLLFVNTKHTAETLGAWLGGNDYTAGVLSGDVPQKQRERLLEQFKEGKISVLVATDVAARGLHIPDVSHVINFDLPQDAEDYVHRVGRTARAGASGDAISFACETHAFSLAEIEQFVGHKIPVGTYDTSQLPTPAPPARIRSDTRRARPGRHKENGNKSRGRPPRKPATSRDTAARKNKPPQPVEHPVQAAPVVQTPAQSTPSEPRVPISGPRKSISEKPAERSKQVQPRAGRKEIPAVG
jgi:ATP-dependent RNA helicase RhlB